MPLAVDAVTLAPPPDMLVDDDVVALPPAPDVEVVTNEQHSDRSSTVWIPDGQAISDAARSAEKM